MRHLDFFSAYEYCLRNSFGPISLIRFCAPFAIWIAYCVLLNAEWIAIQYYAGLWIYSCSWLMFHAAIKWFWIWIWINAEGVTSKWRILCGCTSPPMSVRLVHVRILNIIYTFTSWTPWLYQASTIPLSNSKVLALMPSCTRRKRKLEIVNQWSTRIPPPHRRGWHCSKSQGNHFESDIADNR